MSILIVGMDATVVSVALPSIGREMGATVAGLQWATAAYTVTLASLLMLGGATADRFGRVRVFQLGLATFTGASLGCSAAPTIGWLIAFRVLQGVGGSMMNPVALSIVRVTFEDPRERAQAIGVWAAVVGIGMALGPALGGPLTELSWRAVFLVNVPVGIAAIVLTARFIPASRPASVRKVDAVGQTLVIVLLVAITVAIIEGPARGWTSPLILGLAATAAAALVAFVRYEARISHPLLDPRFFRSRPFASATAIAVAAFTAFGGFLFIGTLYLQEVRLLSPAAAGLHLLPLALATAVTSPISGRIVGRRGVRAPLVVGGLAMAGASAMLTALEANTSTTWILAAYCLFGIGFGALNPPITNTAVSGMPAAQAGVAGAVTSTARQLGQTLGVAIVGAMLAASVTGHAVAGTAAAGHAAFWLIVVLGLVIVVLGLLASTPAARLSAERAAARLCVPQDVR